MLTSEQKSLLYALHSISRKQGIKIYLVGGIVRDILLRHDLQDKDLDFIVEGDAIEFAQYLNRDLDGSLKKFPDFLTAKITAPRSFPSIAEVDLASVRTEIYQNPGSLPSVSPAKSIEEDLKRRDFSVNAMALSLEELVGLLGSAEIDLGALRQKLVDKFNGLADLDQLLIRVLHPLSFIDDPTRIFRACRYAARLSGKLTEQTDSLLRAALESKALDSVSNFRKLNEIKKVLEEPKPFAALGELLSKGVFDHFCIFERAETERFFEHLSSLFSLNLRVKSEVLEAVFFALCLNTFVASEGPALYRSLGFSKKLLGLMEASLDQARTVTSTQLSEKSDQVFLIAGALGRISPQEFQAQAAKRRLLADGEALS